MLMDIIDRVKDEIAAIKDRNTKVEIDKARETSLFRKISIAVLTYIVVVLFFLSVGFDKPFLNALVPTLGFVLSTLSLGFLKQLWMRTILKK